MGWKYRRRFLKAQKLMEANDLVGAEKVFSELIEEKSKEPDPFLHRAYVRLRMGKLDEALADTEQCVKLRPENSVGFMVRGEILLEKRNFQEAYEILRKACELEKDNGRAHYHLGRAALGLNRKQEASDYFEIALQFERDYCLAQWMGNSISA
jgi:predicted Zn-dependent protease